MPVIRAALERGQRVRMTVNGSSMLPFIHDGDVVVLEPIHSLLRRGDVALLQYSEEHYIMHRVVRTEGDALFIRGDAQLDCQGPFAPRDVVGRVSLSECNGRTRALDRGVWRFAGCAWIVCGPSGLMLQRLTAGFRRIGGRARRAWRQIPPFRSRIREADPVSPGEGHSTVRPRGSTPEGET
jgi:hypothetical protein